MRCAVVAAACAKERSGVGAVEETVKSVIGPVYDKFHLVPDELLRIAAAPHRHPAPPRTTVSGIAGAVYARCEPAAKVLYERYEARAEQCAAAAWQRLFPRAPKAAEKGCRVSALVATERIANMFGEKRA